MELIYINFIHTHTHVHPHTRCARVAVRACVCEHSEAPARLHPAPIAQPGDGYRTLYVHSRPTSPLLPLRRGASPAGDAPIATSIHTRPFERESPRWFSFCVCQWSTRSSPPPHLLPPPCVPPGLIDRRAHEPLLPSGLLSCSYRGHRWRGRSEAAGTSLAPCRTT